MAHLLEGPGRVVVRRQHRESWEGLALVERLPVLQAVVELPEEPVEQVACRGSVAVPLFPPTAVVLAGRLAVGRGSEHPDRAVRDLGFLG